MQMKFKGLFNDQLIDVNANNISAVLHSVVSQTTNHPQGYNVGQGLVAQLAKAAKQQGGKFLQNFEARAGALLSQYYSELGLNSAGCAFPDIERDVSQVRILFPGLVQGGIQVGKLMTEEDAWRHCSGMGVGYLAKAFAGYPKHIGRCVDQERAEAYAVQIVKSSLGSDSIQLAPQGISPLSELETTRALFMGNQHLVDSIDNGVRRAAYEAIMQNGAYANDGVQALADATQSPVIAATLRQASEGALATKRAELDRLRTVNRLAALAGNVTAKA